MWLKKDDGSEMFQGALCFNQEFFRYALRTTDTEGVKSNTL